MLSFEEFVKHDEYFTFSRQKKFNWWVVKNKNHAMITRNLRKKYIIYKST